MDTLDFNPARTELVGWPQRQKTIQDIRQACQLQTSYTDDDQAWHFLTFSNDLPIACASISPHNILYGLGVLEAFRHQQYGSALMRFLLKAAPTYDIPHLQVIEGIEDTASLTKSLQRFFLSFDFQTQNDHSLKLQLPPNRNHLHSGSELISLNNISAFQQQYLQFIQQCQRRLVILTHSLEPALFDDILADALLAFIQSSRYAEVRILLKDSHALRQQYGNPVLRLYQRTHSQLSIKKLTLNAADENSAYLISDDQAIIFRKDESLYRGVAYTDNRGRVKTQLEQFNRLWNSAVTDPELTPLA